MSEKKEVILRDFKPFHNELDQVKKSLDIQMNQIKYFDMILDRVNKSFETKTEQENED